MTQINTERETDTKKTNTRVNSKNTSAFEIKNSELFFDKKIVSSNWLTTKEAAEYLRTSPNQIRNWVYQGKLRAYKLFGKSLRFKSSELDLLHIGGQAWE